MSSNGSWNIFSGKTKFDFSFPLNSAVVMTTWWRMLRSLIGKKLNFGVYAGADQAEDYLINR